jgi:hypothetical protein
MQIPWLAQAAFPAFLVVTLTSLALVLSQNWRLSLVVLSLQYVGVFLLSAQSWPIEMAAVKIVAGWMAAAVLGIAISDTGLKSPGNLSQEEQAWPSSRVFRSLAASLVILAAVSLAPNVSGWLPGISLPLALGGVMLLGMGLLQLGLTAHPVRIAMGLLTALSGFEIIYGAAETSTLLAGLLAATQLGLALICAYLLLAPGMEEEIP